MSDPAVEAAQRALESHTGGVLQMADIAREALKPIRNIHYKRTIGEHSWCPTCQVWPCSTAKLIYSTEELAQ